MFKVQWKKRQYSCRLNILRLKEEKIMFDNQFNITPNGGIDPQNICPCTNDGCTHACSTSSIGCFRDCGGDCSGLCLANCSYVPVFLVG